MNHIAIETERLRLRPFNASDLQDFYTYAKNEKIGHGAGWKPHESLAESEEILAHFMEQDDVWAIEDKQTGAIIGSIGLHEDRHRPLEGVRMLGYVLAEPYWGKGIMPEAATALLHYGFTEVGLKLISVYHFSFNDQSRRVIEKLGFTYEGMLRYAFQDYRGKVFDSLCYSMTKEEFINKQN